MGWGSTEVAGRVASVEAGREAEQGGRADRTSALGAELRRLRRVVVALSGGADSAFLAWSAQHVLGRDSVLCLTAVSPSLAAEERRACASLARDWGLRWREVATGELANPAYAANDAQRCYHCKAELMALAAPLAAAEGATVVLGVNLDDLGEHRPGQLAAAERGAEFPLVTAGFTKADVREASRAAGLRTWDKPAAACLASRVPYGTPVTFAVLASVDRAEAGLRALGFQDLRVRHYGELARIEVPVEDLHRIVAQRRAVVGVLEEAGYAYVTVDLEGLRSGNLNMALAASPGTALER